MEGKTVIVTGANAGIGKTTAASLYANGACVIMACRSLQRGEAARQEIEAMLASPESSRKQLWIHSDRPHPGKLLVRELDVSDLESVKRFAISIVKEFSKIDVLVNNAGINGMGTDIPSKTPQGIPFIFGTNFVGHFLLTRLLHPNLSKSGGGRIVNLSSVMHHWGSKDVSKAVSSGKYPRQYQNSKLAMVHLTAELQRQYAETRVSSVAVNPGFVASDIWRGIRPDSLVGRMFRLAMAVLALDTKQGAATSVAAACMSDEEICGSKVPLYLVPYWVPSFARLPFEMMGVFTGVHSCPPRVSKNEKQISMELWKECTKLCAGYLE
ncbi:hypothetical protein GUITHDRAFT_108486 [Guillardia theta CCMP2712]|uniref:Uncharacterized protein n=3 Tax=Guillardia theta TaxID=55529 RepID=L1JAQ5_GUITC|nr:hypothetical protein GUITHDRAFT_108486 [Guillardia theta CCMP2712]EKX45611.1 hypothetical protein GUITHDRAFT_108486 [Guillardia theta CCMP2712]|mmetsp:Transcript_22317/g.73360  ORF Transcript_22317/g.73360 Transcript_22317/m.73360 type:complete len:325 (+) Transcript_22317:193-1167(+)|eukprot:XP_005832591.1 hypothetical protein GUITHDRAFT_108486 [Guillardia theta CCMP2712]